MEDSRSSTKVQAVQEPQKTAGDAGLSLPIQGMKLTPYGWPAMAGAYIGLLYFLLGKQEACDAFRAETGHDILRVLMGRGMEAMVDKATGYDRTVVAAFADWVTETQWGVDGDEALDEIDPDYSKIIPN